MKHGENTTDADTRIDDWRAFAPLDLHPILAAALEQFREHGYHGTTVREVAPKSACR
jgi:hypothetical protein